MDHRNIIVNLPCYSLAGAVGDTYTHPQNHTCNFWRPCQRLNLHEELCRELINCITAADHFRDRHGIVGLQRKKPIICQWAGCLKQISKHNYVRHVRERHLGCRRRS
ncbi:hypothetical protein V8B97DRAFT_2020490 [Scleroderma yunnanense]